MEMGPCFRGTPFVFIALAVLFRSYSLTMSFDPLTASGPYWDTTFGLYQLVPFLLAIPCCPARNRSGRKQTTHSSREVMFIAPTLLVIAYPWLVPWSRLPANAAFVLRFR